MFDRYHLQYLQHQLYRRHPDKATMQVPQAQFICCLQPVQEWRSVSLALTDSCTRLSVKLLRADHSLSSEVCCFTLAGKTQMANGTSSCTGRIHVPARPSACIVVSLYHAGKPKPTCEYRTTSRLLTVKAKTPCSGHCNDLWQPTRAPECSQSLQCPGRKT